MDESETRNTLFLEHDNYIIPGSINIYSGQGLRSVLISSTLCRIEGFAAQLYQPGNPAATYVLPGPQSSALKRLKHSL